MPDQAKQFLDVLFGRKEEQENILVWTLDGKRSAWFKDLGEAAAFIRANSSRDVYVGVSASPQAHGADQRLKIEGCERLPSSLSALFTDLDIAGPGHTKKNLPPDEASAMSILFPEAPPSIVVHTGGGIQAWWPFKEPWILTSEEDIQKATALSKRWIRALRARAAAKGFDVDQVGDLTRVLRIPGTTNCKVPSQPRPVVLREINDREYDPSSLEEYLDLIGATRMDTPAARGIVVGQLLYDPTAEYIPTRFDLLCAAEPKFLLSWQHKRAVRELPDQSPSAYDQALANIAAQAGWSDQEIANLLIAHRRRYGVDLKLRDSYYVATIRKARELAGEAQVWNNIEEIIATQDAQEINPVNESDTNQKPEGGGETTQEPPKKSAHVQNAMTALDHLTQILGIKIIQIYKYHGEQPSYRLKCEKGATGEIDMGGIQSLTEQRVFRDHVAALTNHRIPTLKPPEWDKVSRLLLASLTDVELGPEAKAEGMIRSWLDQYFEGLAIQDTIEEADQCKGPFRSKNRVCFYLASFQRWATSNHGADRFTTPALLRVFDRLGIDHDKIHLSGSSRHVYTMPAGYVPPRAVRKGQEPAAPTWVEDEQIPEGAVPIE